MSVLIKGMDMPKGCKDCPLCSEFQVCNILNKSMTIYIENPLWVDEPDECPLVEIPTPHGDLIDRDAIVLDYSGLAYISSLDFIGIAKHFADQIEKMPPVIEAEE